ncbi:MAG TPA: hypothetical protein VMT20_00250 [Terriglobia bacterium]|nr:hypothetical protein [Terriglobia bacterium]
MSRTKQRLTKKKPVHSANQIDGDLAARQEGFGSQAEREALHGRRAGQSGDTQGVSDIADADSESVEELLEEGQTFEAGIISGVERAGDADAREVETKEVAEDDVPAEYDDRER